MLSSDTEPSWLPTSDVRVMDAAVLYTEHGWPVIRVYGVTQSGECQCQAGAACKTPGKHPIGKDWRGTAARDPDAARDMFRSHVGNIGIPIPNHLVALDIDDESTVQAWPHALPNTLTAYSGSGRGRHLLYRLTPEQAAQLKNKRIAPGVDLRVGGGQIVVAPSRHASGGQYTWGPLTDIAPMPAWLFEMAVAAKAPNRPTLRLVSNSGRGYVSAMLDGVCEDIRSADEGERNNTLFSKATHAFEVLLSRELDPEGHMDVIADAARAAGLDDVEIEKTLASALQTARRSPSSEPPPQPSPSATPDDWRAELVVSKDDTIKKVYSNATLILRHDTDVEYNVLTETPEWRGTPLTDARLGELREQIFERRHRFAIALDMLWQAVIQVANERSYHPVHRYLSALEWDGTPRIGRILHHVLGHAEPTEHDQSMLRAWLISAVARVMRPGCKADAILVLVGPQGYYKSSFFDALATPWFSDTVVTPTTDGALRLRRTWITELAEIDQLTSGFDAAKIKAFITARSDVLRRPYGRVTEALDRHSVFAGTTNEHGFLSAETGTRRFWVIDVPRPVDRAVVAAWRDQVWAEAVHAYRAGEPWWLSAEAESGRAQAAEEFIAHDPWEAALGDWLKLYDGQPVTTAQAAASMQLDMARLDMHVSRRIGKIMRKFGRKQQAVRSGTHVLRAWVPVTRNAL